MSNPFQNFQQGLMTGAQLGQGAYRQGQRRELASAYQTGGMTGAATAAFGQGDFESGLQLQQRGRQEGVGTALASGDFEAATTAAGGDVQLLGQIRQWKTSATEQEKAAASERFGQLAAIGQAVRALPPEQRLVRAQQLAPQFQIDPTQITEDSLTDEALEGITMRALGIKDYLDHKQDERDANSPRYVPALGGFIMPPGSNPQGGQPEAFDDLPQGARIRPRNPNQPPAATAAVGGERSQTPRVSFRSSQEAAGQVRRMVPGINVTNSDRTAADTARLRRQGYNPSDTSFHLQGQALDLTPPAGMTMRQLEAKMRQAGFRVLNEGHHIHVSW